MNKIFEYALEAVHLQVHTLRGKIMFMIFSTVFIFAIMLPVQAEVTFTAA